jgi:hypothetical protein
MIDVFNTTGANVAAFGGRGLRLLTDGQSLPVGEEAYALLALDNTIVTATLNNEIGDNSFSTTLFAGIMVYSNITALTVGTGILICYLK